MSIIIFFIFAAAIFLISLGLIYLPRFKQAQIRLQSVENLSQKIIENARYEADTVKKEALLQTKKQIFQIKESFENESKEYNQKLNDWENRLIEKEKIQEKKTQIQETYDLEFTNREHNLTKREQEIEEHKNLYLKLINQQKEFLERIAVMSQQEANKQLIQSIKSEAQYEAAKTIKRIEQETRETAAKKAQEILALACKRYACEYAAEKTMSVVSLPNDEMKGRIIGREGRNIRAIEAATGIDLIIDDTPEAVILSGFNPIRREIARLSLERLISDGRIHPTRIEEIVKKITSEVEISIKDAGEQASFDVGVHGINPDLVKFIGKLRYRSSYAQNVLQHSLEVAFLCGIMASELGINAKHARRAGLLHDIGKAVDHEIEGPHAIIGANLAKRYGEKTNIVHAIQAHHEDILPENVLAILVQTADTLSGARPGARHKMLENYIKRLEDLERIANSFEGVASSYAIQAGREVRIVLEAEKTTDEQAYMLSHDVARKVETEMMYPGQIKVTVIRETRAIDYAK